MLDIPMMASAWAGRGSLETALQAITQRQDSTEEKLAQQQQEINELRQKLSEKEGERGAGGEGHGGRTTRMSCKVANGAEMPNDLGEQVAVYEMSPSMWDAMLLLYVMKTSFTDKLILCSGMILNLGLQAGLLAVIAADMLEPEYTDEKVQAMLAWRVEMGHSDELFFTGAGSGGALGDRLCNQQLWSFEQSEYDEIHDYLYKPVPGIVLSLLAIVLWILTCATEYRSIVEQFLALLRLPSLPVQECVRETEDGGIEIQGIRPCQRAVAMITLTLPRMVVLGWLTYVGCQYLARTLSLADIVLNAVALSFVLDVDESLCSVLLSQRLRSTLAGVWPIKCGHNAHTVGGVASKDLLRYMLSVGMLLFTYQYFLEDFNEHVTAASAALCGGLHGFTYTGGTETSPTIVLKNASDYVDECTSDVNQLYMSKYYGGLLDENATEAEAIAPSTDWEAKRLTAIVAYAMKGCPEGEVLRPRLGEDIDRTCMVIPPTLASILENIRVSPGSHVDPPNCQRFDPNLGADSCKPLTTTPDSCVWSWQSQTCEENTGPPGIHYQNACGESLTAACNTWERFGRQHPKKNCEAKRCPPADTGCLAVTGLMELRVSNSTAFHENETATLEAVETGMAVALQLTVGTGDKDTKVDVIFESSYESSSRRLQEASESLRYFITRMPDSLTREALLAANVSMAAAIDSELNVSLGLADMVLGMVWSGGVQDPLDFRKTDDMEVYKEELTKPKPSSGSGPGQVGPGTSMGPAASPTGPAPTPAPGSAPGTGTSPTPTPQPQSSPGSDPSPSPSPSPTPSPEPVPTPQPQSSAGPSPSPTPEPAASSPSPEPTPSPEPSPTPGGQGGGGNGPGPEPSPNPSPSPEPESSSPSSASPEPTPSPGPSPSPGPQGGGADGQPGPSPSPTSSSPSPSPSPEAEAPSPSSASPEPTPSPGPSPSPGPQGPGPGPSPSPAPDATTEQPQAP